MEKPGDELVAQPRSIQQLKHRKGLRPLSLDLFPSGVPTMEDAVDSPCSFFDASPGVLSRTAPNTPLGFPELHPSPCSPASKSQTPWESAVCPWAPIKKRLTQPQARAPRSVARNLFGATNPNAGP